MKEVAMVRNFAKFAFLLAFLVVLPVARADKSDQATKVTFSQPVQIPGRVLPAGSYWFVLPDHYNQHNEVRIFSADRTTLLANLFTIDAQRQQSTDTTAITFAERGSAQPQAIMTWFYPGRSRGHEFLYPKRVQEELAKDKQVTTLAGD